MDFYLQFRASGDDAYTSWTICVRSRRRMIQRENAPFILALSLPQVNVPRENGGAGPLGKRGLTAVRGPNRILGRLWAGRDGYLGLARGSEAYGANHWNGLGHWINLRADGANKSNKHKEKGSLASSGVGRPNRRSRTGRGWPVSWHVPSMRGAKSEAPTTGTFGVDRWILMKRG